MLHANRIFGWIALATCIELLAGVFAYVWAELAVGVFTELGS